MGIINIYWTKGASAQLQPGAQPGEIYLEVSKDGTTVATHHSPQTIGFSDQLTALPPGTYDGKIYAKDSLGAMVGSPVTAQLVVPEPPVFMAIPDSLTMTLG
jgi:hypothetical protein